MGTAYLTRIIVLRKINLEAAGCFQAAWTLGGYYISFILQAMGADFYPRLTAVANDHAECNRLVNEQAEVGLLLAGPGIIATLTFAPLVMQLFYASEFWPAVEVLRWICLGMTLRVASWPMGFILLAKGARKLFFWSELFAIALCGAGLAGSRSLGIERHRHRVLRIYIVAYWIGIYMIVRRLSGFRWSPANRRVVLLFAPVVAAVFVSWYFLPSLAAMIFGAAITLLTGIYSLKTLCALVPLERCLPRCARMIIFFRSLLAEHALTLLHAGCENDLETFVRPLNFSLENKKLNNL